MCKIYKKGSLLPVGHYPSSKEKGRKGVVDHQLTTAHLCNIFIYVMRTENLLNHRLIHESALMVYLMMICASTADYFSICSSLHKYFPR